MRYSFVAAAALVVFASGCGDAPTSSKPADSHSAKDAAAPSGAALHLSEATFKTEIAEYNGVAMLDFWATWCGPCRMIAPAVEELATELKGKAKIAKVDVDQNMNLAKEFKIESIPCLILFKNGKEIDRKVGVVSKDDLKNWIEAAAK